MDLGVSVLEVSQIYILSLSSSPPPHIESHLSALFYLFFGSVLLGCLDFRSSTSVFCVLQLQANTPHISDFPLLFLKQ